MPGPRTDQAKSPWSAAKKKTPSMAHALQESTWQHENPTKSATNSASSANFFEVPADAHEVGEVHGSTSWCCMLLYCMITTLFSLSVGNPMSFSASPTWSFWLLETPLVGFPMWLPVLSSRGEGEAPDINASGIHPESRISNVLSNVWSLHPRHVKMHTAYHHHRHQIYGTCLLQDDISETTSLVVNPLIPLYTSLVLLGFLKARLLSLSTCSVGSLNLRYLNDWQHPIKMCIKKIVQHRQHW